MNITPEFKYERSFRTSLSIDEFRQLFQRSLNLVMTEENRSFNFQSDDNNREFIYDIFYYLNYDSKYSGDLDRGMLLIGQIGCGKSILMKTMLKIIELACNKFVSQVHSKTLLSEIETKGIEYYKKRPLYIDDLGKEQKEGKIYGTTYYPAEDIISLRDLHNTITFATGNYQMKSYEEFYTKHIFDRMKTMFNIHTLKGGSRRL